MYKKVELLSKNDHLNLSFDVSVDYSFAKDLKIVSIGLSEVAKASSLLPVIISGGDEQRFVVFSGLNNQDSYYTQNRCQDIYIPATLKGYPFLMTEAHEQNNEERKFRAVAIDVGSSYVSDKAEHKIFKEQDVLSDIAKHKVQMIQKLDIDIANAKRLIAKLKEYNLLDKRGYKVKVENGEEKEILNDFYVVNKKRLYELDDNILLKWAKDGTLFILESHIQSVENISTLLRRFIKDGKNS